MTRPVVPPRSGQGSPAPGSPERRPVVEPTRRAAAKGRDRSGKGRDQAGRDQAGRDSRGPDRPRQDELRSDELRSDEPRSDEPRSDEPRSDEPRSDEPRSGRSRSAGGRDTGERAARPPRSVTREPRRPSSAPPAPRRSTATYRRRRLAAALVTLAVLVGVGFGIRVILYDSGLVNVQDVQVTGVTTITVADVRTAAAVTTGAPLAGIDTAAIAARVAALPAVASVGVGRGWPHTVTVAVTERVPAAVVTTPRGIALVDRGGVVYPGTPPAGLPTLNFGAVGPDDPSTRAALAALAALPDAVRSQVKTVDATATGGAPARVTMGLADGRQVLWGASDRGAGKAAVLVPLLTEPGHIFDVTSPDLPTIRR